MSPTQKNSPNLSIKRVLRSGLVFMTLAFSGCVSFVTASESAKTVILSFKKTAEGVDFQVPTGGCTDKKSFEVQVNHKSETEVMLTLLKKTLDHCKGYFPHGIKISYTWFELDLSNDLDIKITNETINTDTIQTPSK